MTFSWLPAGWDDSDLELALYGATQCIRQAVCQQRDSAAIYEQLRGQKHVTCNCFGKDTGRPIPDPEHKASERRSQASAL